MKDRKIVLDTGIIVLMVLAATLTVVPSVLAAYPANSTYFVPENSTGAFCENNTIVQVRANVSFKCYAIETDIFFDPDCVNITAVNLTGSAWSFIDPYFSNHGNYVIITSDPFTNEYQTGDLPFVNLTLHCVNDTCNCTSSLLFDYVELLDDDANNHLDDVHNGTFTCGAVETFSKNLYEGWNLVSLPLTPEDSSTNAVLSSLTGNYDAVYKYDASSHSFVIADTMDPGTAYFINMTANDTWTYEGIAYKTIDVDISQGLNMLGWLNCTKDISDALASIENNYRYVARWNAISQGYEVYVPGAPEVFNDFTELERGEGYWIVAKQNCTLTGSCLA